MRLTSRSFMPGSGLLLLSACFSVLSAEPTHELTKKFEATVSGEIVVLEAGARLEILQMGDPTAFAKFTLPDGKSTILQIPASQLKKIEKPATTPIPLEASGSPAPAAPSQPVFPNSTKLTSKDGATMEGTIIRVEKSVVVLYKEGDQVDDIPLSSLDDAGLSSVKAWEDQSRGKPAIPDPRVVPGKKISLTFPELGPSNQSNPPRIQIRIPENYKADQTSPLALFLAGGGGSDNCDALNGFVDSKDYILVAFPYSKAYPSPNKAYQAGHSKELIDFQRPMLERLKQIVPNSDPAHRVVIGTSNGAHTIAIASCDGWEEFSDFFSAFVLHEGGGCMSRDYKNLRKKDVFVLIGETSEARAFAEWVVKSMEKDRVKPETYLAKGEGHGMGGGSRQAIKEWIAKIRTTSL